MNQLCFVILKRPVEHHFMIVHPMGGVHQTRYELGAFSGCATHIRVSSRVCESGFDPVRRGVLPKVFVFAYHQAVLKVDTSIDHLLLRSDDFAKIGSFQGLTGDEAKIV